MKKDWSFKKVLIWALIMGFSSTLFGVEYGLIPGLILSWLISKAVDKYDEKYEGENKNNKIDCQEHQTTNTANIEQHVNSETTLKKEIIGVDAKPIIVENEENEKNKENKDSDVNVSTPIKLEENIESKNLNESDTKNIFCRKCGTKLDSDAKYCRKCGTKIEE